MKIELNIYKHKNKRARPTNQERDDRDGAAVFRPANGGEREMNQENA